MLGVYTEQCCASAIEELCVSTPNEPFSHTRLRLELRCVTVVPTVGFCCCWSTALEIRVRLAGVKSEPKPMCCGECSTASHVFEVGNSATCLTAKHILHFELFMLVFSNVHVWQDHT